MSNVVRALVTVVAGLGLAFFVAVSVFADGSGNERLITIGGILVGYLLAGIMIGYRAPVGYGLGLAAPGLIVVLLFAMTDERAWWHLGYAVLILVASTAGSVVRGGILKRDA